MHRLLFQSNHLIMHVPTFSRQSLTWCCPLVVKSSASGSHTLINVPQDGFFTFAQLTFSGLHPSCFLNLCWVDLKLSRFSPSHFPVQECVWGSAQCRIQTHLAAIAYISSLFTVYSFLQSPIRQESAVRILPYKCHPESFWFKTSVSLTPKHISLNIIRIRQNEHDFIKIKKIKNPGCLLTGGHYYC